MVRTSTTTGFPNRGPGGSYTVHPLGDSAMLFCCPDALDHVCPVRNDSDVSSFVGSRVVDPVNAGGVHTARPTTPRQERVKHRALFWNRASDLIKELDKGQRDRVPSRLRVVLHALVQRLFRVVPGPRGAANNLDGVVPPVPRSPFGHVLPIHFPGTNTIFATVCRAFLVDARSTRARPLEPTTPLPDREFRIYFLGSAFDTCMHGLTSDRECKTNGVEMQQPFKSKTRFLPAVNGWVSTRRPR